MSVGPPLWFRLKNLNYCWLDCHEIVWFTFQESLHSVVYQAESKVLVSPSKVQTNCIKSEHLALIPLFMTNVWQLTDSSQSWLVLLKQCPTSVDCTV